MAGSIVTTVTEVARNLIKYSIAWTADGSGNVNSNPIALRHGRLSQIKFVPTNGGTQPSNGYNVSLPDADGVDLLAGQGQNLSNTAAKLCAPVIGGVSPALFPYFVEDQTAINPTITGAGANANGRIDLYIGPI